MSPASRQLLALLVAAGPHGIAAADLARERGATPSDQAIRMATTRLRKHFPSHVSARTDDGIYRLEAQPADVDAWRLIQLATDPGATFDLAELQHLLRFATPYEGVPSSEFLEDSERRIRELQREVFVKLAIAHPAAMTGVFLDSLIAHSHDDLLNEPLLLRAAMALTSAGRRTEAIKLIGQAHAAFVDTGLTLGDDVVAFEKELLDGRHAVVSPTPTDSSTKSLLPNQLRSRLTGKYVGNGAELARVREVLELPHRGIDAVVLSGPSGAGKTRLCAEAAATAIEIGWNVVLLSPSTLTGQAPFAPIAAAMPELSRTIPEIIGSSADADSVRAALWDAVAAALAERAAEAPLLVIVDDGQWLDEATSEFLLHYASTTVSGRVVLLINGRYDVIQSDRWHELHDRLDALGAVRLELAPLDADGIRALIDDQRPGMEAPLLAAVSEEILERSAGLPGIAGPLLAAMPPGSAVLPAVQTLSQRAPLGPAIDSLSERARSVGVAAAVIGPHFRFDGLEAVTSLDQDDLLAGLEELLDRGLVIDRSLVDFEMAHALVERGLIGIANRSQLARIHAAAADFYRDDVHRRAHHLWSALPISSMDDAVGALTESAVISVSERCYRRSIRQFDAVRQLRPDALTPWLLGRFARALDLSGMHAAALERRQEGFDRAVEDHDWATALDVALSGFPEGEPLDGSDELIENLLRVDAAALSPHDAWIRATTLSKQFTVVGRRDEAMQAAEESERWASDPDERVGSALARRYVLSTLTSPAQRLAVMKTVAHEIDHIDDRLKGDYLLYLALDQYQNGDTAAARATVDRLERVKGRSVAKVWQSKMTRSMLLTDAGQSSKATSLRTKAHTFAVSSGLAEADRALLAATFIDLWLAGEIGAFLDEVDDGILDEIDDDSLTPSRRHLTKGGSATVLLETGNVERAVDIAIECAEAELARPTPQTLAVLAAVSASLAESGNDGLIDNVRQIFDDVGPCMVVISAGAANMGPLGRYSARLAPTLEERIERLTAALDFADHADALLWRVIARRDLVEAGRTEYLDELVELVRKTELEHLLDGLGAGSPLV